MPSAVLGDDALLSACARHVGIDHRREPGVLRETLGVGNGNVLLLDHVEAEGFDIARFAHQVLAPSAAALASGRLATLAIHTHRGQLRMNRKARWKLWRRAGVFLDGLRRALDDDGDTTGQTPRTGAH